MQLERILMQTARAGTVRRGYRLPKPLKLDPIAFKIDVDLQGDLEQETTNAFQQTWRGAIDQLDCAAGTGQDSDSIQPSAPGIADGSASKASVSPKWTPRPSPRPRSIEKPSSTELDLPRRPEPPLPPMTVRQSNAFRLNIVGPRRGPQTPISPLQKGRGVSKCNCFAGPSTDMVLLV